MTPDETAQWRVVQTAALHGDVTALAMVSVHLRWIEAGIDRVDEELGMQFQARKQTATGEAK